MARGCVNFNFIFNKKLAISTHILTLHVPLSSSESDLFKLLDNLIDLTPMSLFVTVDDLLKEPLSVGVGAEQSSLQHIKIYTLVLWTALLTIMYVKDLLGWYCHVVPGS